MRPSIARTFSARTLSARTFSDRAWLVITAAIAATALLAIPFLTLRPDVSASQEPGGAVFDARDRIDERFVSSVFSTFVIAEAPDGDMLTKAPLLELLTHEQDLRGHKELGQSLFSYFEPETRTDVVGVATIADLIDGALAPTGGLAAADDAEVKTVAARLIEELGVRSNVLGLSAQTIFDEDRAFWVSPAVSFPVLSDNDRLGFVDTGVTLGGDTASEEHSRAVVEVLRGDETTIRAWGVAIDVNLTSQEQGEAAGPFIGFTILAVLLIVGVTFRSYWVLAITGAALASLIIWLQGISNLIGLEDDLILSLIVPIAMISFGVDFAFHAVGRYREERATGLAPRVAVATSAAAVGGALALALGSDSVAFLANTASGIESIVQFGIGAAIALVAAYLLLGLVTPLAVAVFEERIGAPVVSRRATLGRVTASVAAGLAAMTTVLLQVFILPAAGVVALGLYLVLALAVPYRRSRRRPIVATAAAPGAVATSKRVGNAVRAVAARRRIVMPAAAAVTIVAVVLAVQVPTEFDVKDFFAADTDFVVGLDKLDEHVGDLAGEPAEIYVEAPLDDPRALRALSRFETAVRAIDSTQFTHDAEGRVSVDGGVLSVIREMWASPPALSAFEASSGFELTDTDEDGIPDDGAQLEALYGFTRRTGVPFDETRLAMTPDEVSSSIWVSGSGESFATVMTLGLTNSRLQESIVEARDQLAPAIDRLRSDLRPIAPQAVVQLTGSPIVRQTSLEAISRALQVSLPIAVALCLLLAAAFMRSVRYGLVTIVPILMTVAWLYAFMEILGFSINIVTATIGAVSVGIGIDFSIHYAMRYREELAASGVRLEAVRAAGEGTGAALVASALSSVVGFAILALAPMPLFASYGLLTAVMILMALTATLLVLPSLLMLVSRDDSTHQIRIERATALQSA